MLEQSANYPHPLFPSLNSERPGVYCDPLDLSEPHSSHSTPHSKANDLTAMEWYQVQVAL